MKRKLNWLSVFILSVIFATAQNISPTAEQIKLYTSEWKGKRFSDGRPKVPDIIIERLQNCTLQQVWDYMDRQGYR